MVSLKSTSFLLRRSLSVGFILCLLLVASCKKTNTSSNPNPVIIDPVVKTVDLRDTLANYAKLAYYWNANIPASFNPHSYSSTDGFYGETIAIRGFSSLDPTTGNNLDRFSFVLTEAQYQQEFVGGSSAGYGMYFRFDRNGIYRIRYAAHASQAYAQGVRRGWEVDSINGIVPSNDTTFLHKVSTALGGNTVRIAFKDPNGNKHPLLLNSASIVDDEVITTKVIDTAGKKIGYMVYNTFLPLASSTSMHPGLDSAFKGLAAKGITDLIIDLRYNSGGYVEIVQEMANALVPASNQGKVLFTEKFNSQLSVYNTSTLVDKNNAKNPPAVNPNSVTFIVSEGTASASELIINSLLPYFSNVKLIGVTKGRAVSTNTAGKPFGFFNEPFPSAMHQYEAFLINDETKNALGQDNYTAGFLPDVQVYDGVEYDWGNLKEDGFAEAIHYLVTGTLSFSGNNALSIGNGKSSMGLILNDDILIRNKVSGIFHKNSLKKFRTGNSN